jgi:hypothetical protein
MAARTLKSPENYIKISKNVCRSHYGAYVNLGREDAINPTRIGGVEKMKRRSSVIGMAIAAITVTMIHPGAALTDANAQNASTAQPSATTPPPASAAHGPALPYGASEVLKMYQSGINKDVLVNYVNNTVLPYHLNADGIIYLQTLGMPQEVTQAMIQRDGQLQQQATQQYYQQQQMAAAMGAANGAAAAQSPAQVVTPTTPAPAVTVIGDSDYPYYDSGYPYYYGYGWPYYGVGGGWGWGWGGWGWGAWRVSWRVWWVSRRRVPWRHRRIP